MDAPPGCSRHAVLRGADEAGPCGGRLGTIGFGLNKIAVGLLFL